MNKVAVVPVVIAITCLLVIVYLFYYEVEPDILSKGDFPVTRIDDKFKYVGEDGVVYYRIDFKRHEESNLSYALVDKETFETLEVGDLVTYKEDLDPKGFILEHYEK